MLQVLNYKVWFVNDADRIRSMSVATELLMCSEVDYRKLKEFILSKVDANVSEILRVEKLGTMIYKEGTELPEIMAVPDKFDPEISSACAVTFKYNGFVASRTLCGLTYSDNIELLEDLQATLELAGFPGAVVLNYKHLLTYYDQNLDGEDADEIIHEMNVFGR